MNEPLAPASAFCSQCGRNFATEDLMLYGDSHVCAECKATFLQRLREGSPIAAPGALEYGSVGWRFLAVFIDGVIVILINLLAGFVMAAGLPGLARKGPLFGYTGLGYNLVSLAIGFCYTVFFVANGGATPGKMVFGLKVVRPDGTPATFGQAVGRYFCQWLDAITLSIGNFIAFFDDEHRAMHDRICGTRVIKSR